MDHLIQLGLLQQTLMAWMVSLATSSIHLGDILHSAAPQVVEVIHV